LSVNADPVTVASSLAMAGIDTEPAPRHKLLFSEAESVSPAGRHRTFSEVVSDSTADKACSR
jgi:hypothetical protein